MKFSTLVGAGIVAALLSAGPVLAGDITVENAYVRSSTPSSKTAAAFLMLVNNGAVDDRLIAASADVAKRVELHTHKDIGNGVMQMREIEGGIVVPAGGMHHLKRGGDHIMFMGLTAPLVQGEDISVTLTFEKAGEMKVPIPIDHERKPNHAAMDHSHDG